MIEQRGTTINERLEHSGSSDGFIFMSMRNLTKSRPLKGNKNAPPFNLVDDDDDEEEECIKTLEL